MLWYEGDFTSKNILTDLIVFYAVQQQSLIFTQKKVAHFSPNFHTLQLN